jgi:hypothetical protein
VLKVESPLDLEFTSLLFGSHQRLLGKPTHPGALSGRGAAIWIYREAPFVVLAQDAAVDATFVYANIAAQRCFEYSWPEIRGLPSRFSALSSCSEMRPSVTIFVA